MKAWAKRLGALGNVASFDYPYQLAGKKRPDPHEVLLTAHLQKIVRIREKVPGPLVLMGKSMGSRMGCHASLETTVEGLVCFGYPLRSTSGKLRDEVLLALRTPILFVQGSKDPLCPLQELERVREKMTAPHELFVVENGNHSLEVPKRQEPQAEVDARVLAAVKAWVERVAERP